MLNTADQLRFNQRVTPALWPAFEVRGYPKTSTSFRCHDPLGRAKSLPKSLLVPLGKNERVLRIKTATSPGAPAPIRALQAKALSKQLINHLLQFFLSRRRILPDFLVGHLHHFRLARPATDDNMETDVILDRYHHRLDHTRLGHDRGRSQRHQAGPQEE
jgi:hypothetical protein